MAEPEDFARNVANELNLNRATAAGLALALTRLVDTLVAKGVLEETDKTAIIGAIREGSSKVLRGSP